MFLDSLKWSSECQRATAVLFPDEIFLKDGTTRLKGIHRYHFEVVFHKFLSFILSAPFQMSPADPSHLKNRCMRTAFVAEMAARFGNVKIWDGKLSVQEMGSY